MRKASVERNTLVTEASDSGRRIASEQRSPTFHLSSLQVYLLALFLGLSVTLYMFPLSVIFATDGFTHPVVGMDATVHVVGQRYFIQDSWSWPVLVAKRLVPPEGTNIAFTDSIPLIAVVTKLFRHSLPEGFTSVFLWLAICWVLQPASAVFALRGTGETRVMPSLAVALMAVSMPTLFFRYVHPALCSHFLLLIALGLYLRIVRRVQLTTLVAAGLLMLVALLVNPYIMYMVIAVLAAGPLTLLVRRDRRWIAVGGWLLLGVAITATGAILLGYSHALPMEGFDFFSMNLLSPVYPFGSSILRGFTSPIDATGGQYEGYQYLGLGILLLLVIADFSLGPAAKFNLLRRHTGLVVVCSALTLFSLSSAVYAGSHLLFHYRVPDSFQQLRVPGRFFWPVAYTTLIAGTAIVSRVLNERLVAVLLLVLSCIQFAEVNGQRKEIRKAFRLPSNWSVDVGDLRPLLGAHSKLTILPKFFCGADTHAPAFMQLFLLASEKIIPVNTMYVGRFTKPQDCRFPEAPIRIDDNELLILAPTTSDRSEQTSAILLSISDWRDICRNVGVLVACSQKLREREDLTIPKIQETALAKDLPTGIGGAGEKTLGSGWSTPEPWGVWSDGPVAQLVAKTADSGHKHLLLRVWAHALALSPETTQQVTVSARGKPIAIWNVGQMGDSEYDALLSPPTVADQPLVIEFRIKHPVSPSQSGLSKDERQLGIGITKFRLDAEPE